MRDVSPYAHMLLFATLVIVVLKITGVSRPTLYHFIGTRGLRPGP